jgi:hypothetical protein
VENLVFTSIATIELLACGFIATIVFVAFKRLYAESLTDNQQAMHEFSLQPNAGDTIHNQFLLGLAIEVDEMRHQEAATTNEVDKEQYRQSMNTVSIEVVDTVLAMNGFDPHAGEIFDEEEGELSDKVFHLSDYTSPKKD